ncbi:Ca2+ regulator and membrane fusion protein Fig1-domain-containing protein, partial [Diaporthe sp. PMI_573]
RFVPFIGYHHVVMMLITGSIVLTGVLSAVCTTEGMRGVYLAAFSYSESPVAPTENTIAAALASAVGNSSQLLEVRVGVLGVCAKLPSNTWACSSSFETISKQVALVQAGDSNTSYDPLGITDLAKGFKEDVTFNGLMFISLAFSIVSLLMLSTFSSWHEEEGSDGSCRQVKPFPSRPVSHAALSCLGISAIMTLLSVFWQHMASSNAAILMEIVTAGVVQSKVGAAAMGLGWSTVFLNAVETVAILIMILSIRVLAQLED